LPAVLRMDYRPVTRAGRMRVLALCWIGVVLVFFSPSTTQEYYSLPCYPAFALLIGSALAGEDKTIRFSTRAVATVATAAGAVIIVFFYLVRHVPAPGDIAMALDHRSQAYTLSLGHIGDLTLESFAYLRVPLGLAALAFSIGAVGAWLGSGLKARLSLAIMMVLLFYASRSALAVFDPYLSSRALADRLVRSPHGELLVYHPSLGFSSVFFYPNKSALLLNGRENKVEY